MHIVIRLYDWGYRAAWAIAALSVPFYIYAAIVTVPASRRIAQEQRRADVERENAAFCTKHGLSPGSDLFLACAADLMDIRQQEYERTAREVRETY